MHEVSLVMALFDQLDRAIEPHPPAAVRQLTVRIGTLAGVDGELFQSAFDGCKQERGYAAAALAVVAENAAWSCEDCAADLDLGGPLRCAACGGTARLRAGGDLILQRIELEVSHV
jgi:hydrogenase nickel incorporation protein HypA/HybF